MKLTVETKIRTEIRDAKTKRLVKRSRWQNNLVTDQGLNGMAGQTTQGMQCSPNQMNAVCLIGSGTNPNSIASGAITFTQSTTTITASAGFFTSAMVGGIFKYGSGSGGVEYYITAFTDSTHVTVDTSATVGTPTVGTVWQVQQTTLQTFLFNSTTYQTNANDCGTTFSGNQITHKRTYIFPQQGSPYTVNEIGYAPATTSNRVCGRLVLSSSDSVGTSNFYVVVISVTLTYSPGTPSSVSNVGTNINTAGNMMIEYFGCGIVSSTGVSNNTSTSAVLDRSTAGLQSLAFSTVDYSQNSAINSVSGVTWNSRISISGLPSWSFDNSKVGTMTLTFNGTASTAGQSLFGISITNSGNQCIADVHFTTPQTAPTGTFQPLTVWQIVYSRTLVN